LRRGPGKRHGREVVRERRLRVQGHDCDARQVRRLWQRADGRITFVAVSAGDGRFSVGPFFIVEPPCSGTPLSCATLTYNNVATGHHSTHPTQRETTNVLFALGAMFSVAGALLYFGAANSADTPVAPAPIPYVKATELLQHANPGRLALLSQVALVMDERDGVMLYGRAIDTPRRSPRSPSS